MERTRLFHWPLSFAIYQNIHFKTMLWNDGCTQVFSKKGMGLTVWQFLLFWLYTKVWNSLVSLLTTHTRYKKWFIVRCRGAKRKINQVRRTELLLLGKCWWQTQSSGALIWVVNIMNNKVMETNVFITLHPFIKETRLETMKQWYWAKD